MTVGCSGGVASVTTLLGPKGDTYIGEMQICTKCFRNTEEKVQANGGFMILAFKLWRQIPVQLLCELSWIPCEHLKSMLFACSSLGSTLVPTWSSGDQREEVSTSNREKTLEPLTMLVKLEKRETKSRIPTRVRQRDKSPPSSIYSTFILPICDHGDLFVLLEFS